MDSTLIIQVSLTVIDSNVLCHVKYGSNDSAQISFK